MAAEPVVVCDFSDLPIIRDRGHRWGRSVLPVVRRIRSYMSGGTMDPEQIDVERSRRIHLAYEPARASEWDAWHLPIADVVSDRPAAVFRAISAIIALLNGARGGLDHMLSADQQDRIWNQCERYYAKWEAEMPERAVGLPASAGEQPSLGPDGGAHAPPLAVGKTAQSVGAADAFLDRLMKQTVQRGTFVTEELAEPLLSPDPDQQMLEEIAGLEQQLAHAQEELATYTRRAAASSGESYRGDIQQWRRELRRLQELLGIEPAPVHSRHNNRGAQQQGGTTAGGTTGDTTTEEEE